MMRRFFCLLIATFLVAVYSTRAQSDEVLRSPNRAEGEGPYLGSSHIRVIFYAKSLPTGMPRGEYAYVFYHVNPEESFAPTSDWVTGPYQERRSVIQVAHLRLEDRKVLCDRDVPPPLVMPT